MSIEVKVPNLPESVADATVLTWHKKIGEKVRRDENIVDLETDKVVLEVPAPRDGVLKEMKQKEGDTVTADDILAIIEEADEKVEQEASSKEEESKKSDEDKKEESKEKDSKKTADLSPSVRRLVSEHDVDVSKISGTGKAGRIQKSDVMGVVHPFNQVGVSSTVSGGDRPEKRVPMSRLRARVAERLLQSQQNAAILTTDRKSVV